jgi:short-subunit dehydrogenase
VTTALVTGASSGIGLELASLMAADHTDVILVARRHERLQQVAADLTARHGIRAWTIAADLSRVGAPGEVAQRIKAIGVEVDILINNAGFGQRGAFAEISQERQLEMLDVNVRALTHLARLFLPAMISRRSGRIMNVASTAAFQPGPLMAVYYASKAYVLSFSVALSLELEKSGVTVTALCPGPTRTEFQAVAGMGGTALGSKGVAMDVRPVAVAGYRGMMRGKRIVTPGLLNKTGALGAKLAPRSLAARIAKLSQEVRNRDPG